MKTRIQYQRVLVAVLIAFGAILTLNGYLFAFIQSEHQAHQLWLPYVSYGSNEAPLAANDEYHTAEDSSLIQTAANGVLANDTDLDRDALRAMLASDVANGSLILHEDGSFEYTPAPDFHGEDHFFYRTHDGKEPSNLAVVTVMVTPVEDDFLAVDDRYEMFEDMPLRIEASLGLLNNESNPDRVELLTLLVSDVTQGALNLAADGSFHYTPTLNFHGEERFTYIATDGTRPSNIATVTVEVSPVNDAPTTRDDAYTATEDLALVVESASGLLGNDADVERDQLRAVLEDDVASGQLVLDDDGAFRYLPATDFNGMDRFTYRAFDGNALSVPATVKLTVEPTVDDLVAIDDSYETNEDSPLVKNAVEGVLANDLHPDSETPLVSIAGDVSYGSLALQTDGSFSYTPTPNYDGQDSFRYVVTDRAQSSVPATVTLTVLPVNDPPIGVDDAYEVTANSQLTVSAADGVLQNDTDPDGDSVQAVLATTVSNGTLTLNADGSFNYSPASNFRGLDSFTYRAGDAAVTSNMTTVTIDVDGANSAPRIVTGASRFSTQIIGTDVDDAHAVVAADFNGDGDIDVAATDYVDGLVLRYENNGNGQFSESVLDANLEGAYPAHVADVDQDGDADLFAGGYLADSYVWYRNNGHGVFAKVNINRAADGAHSLVTGDVDGDGDIDLVTADQDAGAVAWYRNNGSNVFTRIVIDSQFTQAKRAEIADVNGDGDLDVVAASYARDEIAWYENDGSENFSKHVIYDNADGAYYVAADDADGDGDMDLFSASQNDNTIAWYENDGDENFTTRILDTTMEGARSVIAADLDQDGDVDIVAAAVVADVVTWYENDGNGNFTRKVVDNTVNGPYGLFTIDMDRDGDIDVLSASKWSSDVRIHTHYRAHFATLSRGGTLLLDSSRLRTEDSDNLANHLIYTLTDAPNHGSLRINGSSIAVNDTFTQSDINSNRLTYVHNGATQTSDRFTFTVRDGGEGNLAPATGTFQLTITQ